MTCCLKRPARVIYQLRGEILLVLGAGAAGGAVMENPPVAVPPVNVTEEPPGVAMVISAGPIGASAEMLKTAVIWEALTTTTLLTVIPRPETVMVVPGRKREPVRTTGTDVPRAPEDGWMELRTGGSTALMVKAWREALPPAVVTVTVAGPGVAVEAIAKEAVI